MTGTYSGGREILRKNPCILRNNKPAGGGEQQPLGVSPLKTHASPPSVGAHPGSVGVPRVAQCPWGARCHCRGDRDTQTSPRGTGQGSSWVTGLCLRTLHLGQCLKDNWFEVCDLKNVVSEMKPQKGFVLFCSFNGNANLKRLTLKKVKDQQKKPLINTWLYTTLIVHRFGEMFFN